MSEQQEPKRCPFCGGEADTETLQGFDTVLHDSSCAGTGDCPIEGLRGWDVDVWNSRPIEDALRAENERLKWRIRDICKTFQTMHLSKADLVMLATTLEEELEQS